MIRGASGRVLQFLGMVWYRYFRLTPVYLLVIGLIEVSMSWYYSHTMLDLYTIDYENCRKFWWRNALYINTYFPMDERVSVTWGKIIFPFFINNSLKNCTVSTVYRVELVFSKRHIVLYHWNKYSYNWSKVSYTRANRFLVEKCCAID